MCDETEPVEKWQALYVYSSVQTLRERAAAQQSELEAGKSGWTCKICYARDLDASFTGCGHMVSCHGTRHGVSHTPHRSITRRVSTAHSCEAGVYVACDYKDQAAVLCGCVFAAVPRVRQGARPMPCLPQALDAHPAVQVVPAPSIY